MRSALLVSVLSLALLSLLGWARNEAPRPAPRQIEPVGADDEALLFV
ncbi:MAG: hypothetical protein JSU87_09785 [Gemmatimonadota bacterium]|nr:MAG: hypothetical protein JSU87_09785 [Gemmatimonadota bacterium]